jgi:hypothetical protein
MFLPLDHPQMQALGQITIQLVKAIRQALPLKGKPWTGAGKSAVDALVDIRKLAPLLADCYPIKASDGELYMLTAEPGCPPAIEQIVAGWQEVLRHYGSYGWLRILAGETSWGFGWSAVADFCDPARDYNVWNWPGVPPIDEALLDSLAKAAIQIVPYVSQPGQREPKPTTGITEQLEAALSPNQGRIIKRIMDLRTASYDTLRTVPGAWRGGNPTDDAITKQLKAIRNRLVEANIVVGELEISVAKKRVTLKES